MYTVHVYYTQNHMESAFFRFLSTNLFLYQ